MTCKSRSAAVAEEIHLLTLDREYDPHGPAGPTAFWKIDELNEAPREDGQMHPLHNLAAVVMDGANAMNGQLGGTDDEDSSDGVGDGDTSDNHHASSSEVSGVDLDLLGISPSINHT